MGLINWFKSKAKKEREIQLRMEAVMPDLWQLAKSLLKYAEETVRKADEDILGTPQHRRAIINALIKGKQTVRTEWTPTPESNWFYKTWREKQRQEKKRQPKTIGIIKY